MKFHKDCFPIQTIIKDEKIMIVSGWIDETNTYGFYKYGKFWKATDLLSGTLICSCSTRKDCAEYVERNQCRLEEIRKTKKYLDKVETFREEIKKKLK